MRTMGPGARGEDVRDVQARLGALGYRIEGDPLGEFGDGTARAVRDFQQRRQLVVDGLVGEDTWQELVEAGHSLGDRVLYLRLPHHRGDDVRALQGWLNLLGFDAGREDGIFGERTDRAVRDFQRNVGLPGDGIVASATLSSLARLRPVGPGPGRATVREAEALSRLSASLEGARIALDAGHGGDDPGSIGPSGLTEAKASEDLVQALFEQLAGRGSEPFALRQPGVGASPGDRARLANERGAEILISMHAAADPATKNRGARCYYYGRGGYVSQAGQRLAEIILEELTTRLRSVDQGAHPLSVPLLRETRMPAVHVEPCFITNPDEESLLGQPSFRSEVAQAVVTAVERFFDGDVSRARAASTPTERGE